MLFKVSLFSSPIRKSKQIVLKITINVFSLKESSYTYTQTTSLSFHRACFAARPVQQLTLSESQKVEFMALWLLYYHFFEVFIPHLIVSLKKITLMADFTFWDFPSEYGHSWTEFKLSCRSLAQGHALGGNHLSKPVSGLSSASALPAASSCGLRPPRTSLCPSAGPWSHTAPAACA